MNWNEETVKAYQMGIEYALERIEWMLVSEYYPEDEDIAKIGDCCRKARMLYLDLVPREYKCPCKMDALSCDEESTN